MVDDLEKSEPKGEKGQDLWGTFIKIFAVGVTIWAAAFANKVQERLTGMNLLSQREQAESELRATMFGDLIGPIAGQAGANPIDADRELLLAELLALNFHEHFEFKPLLIHIDERLQEIGPGPAGPRSLERKRHELRSIARRVIGRQVASLLAEAGTPSTTARASLSPMGPRDVTGAARMHELRFHTGLPEDISLPSSQFALTDSFEGMGVVIHSPDGRDSIRVVGHDPDWLNETIQIEFRVWERGHGPDPTAGADFKLGWFDFPLTDNTLLKDGNRFAFILRDFQPLGAEHGVITIGVVWFPRGYYTLRERPVNHSDLRKLVGKDANS